MFTTIIARDLTRFAPHSPRERLAGFVIALRAVDKCRATVAGSQGEYHFNSLLDKVLFDFKGITADQFRATVQNSENYEEVGTWLLTHGIPKTPDEIKTWSDKVEAASKANDPVRGAIFQERCQKFGLNPATSTVFDLLEADDQASFFHPIV